VNWLRKRIDIRPALPVGHRHTLNCLPHHRYIPVWKQNASPVAIHTVSSTWLRPGTIVLGRPLKDMGDKY
jgi:hypothetical protein